MNMNPINEHHHRQSGTLQLQSDFQGLPSFICGCHPIAQDEENRSVSYAGIGEHGIPLHVTQWRISLNKLTSKSLFPYKISNGDPYDIAGSIKEYVFKLINLPPCENIVSFYSVICSRDETNLIIFLARNVINGLPVKTYSNVTKWNVASVRKISNTLLETLVYLQKNELAHGNLNDSTVFIDEMGNWKVADHSINTYLNYLASKVIYYLPTVKRDMLALAELIETIGVSSLQVSDFVEKCNLVNSVSELTDHPLLRSLNKSFDDFVVENFVGNGSFGEVLKVIDSRVEKEYAIKRITDTKKSTINKGNLEVKTLAGLQHKNIVRFYRSWTETMNQSDYKQYKDQSSDEAMEVDETIESQNKRKRQKKVYVMYIQMELCTQDLRKVIKLHELENDMPRLRKFLFGIVEGLKFMHSKSCIHRDLKPENIFLTENDEIKIGDFGLSTTRKSLSKKRCGTTLYMAPEIGKRGVQARADMYSLGIILFEMCIPMRGREERITTLKTIRELERPIERFMEDSHPFFEIVKNLLNHVINERYTAIKLLAKFPDYKYELQTTSCVQTLTSK